MKKNSILIAVFAVMAAASVAKAQVDFDGKNGFGDSSLSETIFASAHTTSVAPLPSEPAEVSAQEDSDRDVLNLSIKTAIKDCENKGFVALKSQFEKLMREGNVPEKRDFVYNKKLVYKFPRRIGLEDDKEKPSFASLSANTKGVCMEYETRTTCVNRQVCRVVCQVAGAGIAIANPTTGGILAGAGAGQICQELCSLVPECTTTEVCVREYELPL